VAHEIHQVSRILAIVNREVSVETDLVGVFPKQPRADAMERPGPGQRVGHDCGILADHLARYPLDSARHFGGCPARECQEQDAPWIGPLDDQMCNPVRERVCLSGARAGDDQ
jgi:hypothetical protein